MRSKDSVLPLEFSKWANAVRDVQIQNPAGTEYSSTCPQCKDIGHKGSDAVDRCRWFTANHPHNKSGKPHGWCRRCGLTFWLGDDRKPTPQEMEQSRQMREAAALEAQRKIEETLRLLREEKAWLLFHRNLDEQRREWWRGRGIIPQWQDFWRVGYCPDKIVFIKETKEFAHVPAYTFPKFDFAPGPDKDWQFVNMDYRLVDAPENAGRYRHEKDVPPAPFISRPDLGTLEVEKVIVVEGAVKAGVVHIYATNGNSTQVIGLPGVRSWGDLPKRLKNAGRVYVMFDPDSFIRKPIDGPDWQPPAIDFAREVGPHAYIARIPVKPDDAIIKYGAKREIFQTYLDQARRP